jgi:putative nucleotidyltransferase with HDIG domain
MSDKVVRAVTATFLVAGACGGIIVVYFPPDLSWSWALALAILIVVSITAAALSLRVSEGGATTAINFLPELGAIPLLGPAGAAFLAGFSEFTAGLFIRSKSLRKSAFNLAQSVLAAGAAGITYSLLGPPTSLTSLDFWPALLPFIAAGVVYFSLNAASVVYIISVESGRPISDVWKDVVGRTFWIDIAVSPLALSVPLLYVAWGPIALILTLVPIIGLRYSYGLNLELRNLNRDLLRVLVRTLEAQDPYTSGHSIRVAENSRQIASALGLSRADIRHIETAALLHDIGKIGQEFHQILRQTSPLTDEQKEIIRNHPERGASIIKPVRSLDTSVVDYIRHHHERYDGTGYPAEIGGEDIPIGARVIMVADTIDAMATDRPYRDALSAETIAQELREHKGTQFDPKVVEAAFDARVLEQSHYLQQGSPDSTETPPTAAGPD